MTHPIRSRGEANYPDIGIGLLQLSQECAIHTLGLMRHQMGFIDDHQIDMTDFLIANRLDTGKRDRLSDLPLSNSRRVDSQRSVRPMLPEFGCILLDQLL